MLNWLMLLIILVLVRMIRTWTYVTNRPCRRLECRDFSMESCDKVDRMYCGVVSIGNENCSVLSEDHKYPPFEIPPFFEIEEDDEDIICFDGVEAYAAYRIQHLEEASEVYTAYKRVDRKVKPVPAVFPKDTKVTRSFPENPLDSLPPLPIHPLKFKPNGRLTHECLAEINFNADGFLWPEEEKLFAHVLQLNQDAFVFEDIQRGSFREDYFSPYIIPVISHEPWAFASDISLIVN